jgi:hypothetical protein
VRHGAQREDEEAEESRQSVKSAGKRKESIGAGGDLTASKILLKLPPPRRLVMMMTRIIIIITITSPWVQFHQEKLPSLHFSISPTCLSQSQYYCMYLPYSSPEPVARSEYGKALDRVGLGTIRSTGRSTTISHSIFLYGYPYFGTVAAKKGLDNISPYGSR